MIKDIEVLKDIVCEVKLYESQRKEFKKDVKEAYLSYIKTLYPMTWWFRGDSFFFFRPLIWGWETSYICSPLYEKKDFWLNLKWDVESYWSHTSVKKKGENNKWFRV